MGCASRAGFGFRRLGLSREEADARMSWLVIYLGNFGGSEDYLSAGMNTVVGDIQYSILAWSATKSGDAGMFLA